MFFFKIAEIIISSQELAYENSDFESESSKNYISINEDNTESSVLLDVLNESDDEKVVEDHLRPTNSLLFNLLSRKSQSQEEMQKIQLLSKLLTSKSYLEFPQYRKSSQAIKRQVDQDEIHSFSQIDAEDSIFSKKFKISNETIDDECTSRLTLGNFYQSQEDRLRQSEVLSTLQKISSLVNNVNAENNPALMATPNVLQNISRIRNSISFLKEKIFTTRLSSRDLNLLSNFIRLNTFGISEESLPLTHEPSLLKAEKDNGETERTIQNINDPKNISERSSTVIFKEDEKYKAKNPNLSSRQISVQLAKKTAQPIQARINEFVKQIVEFVSKNYQSIKLTADGLNNNVSRSETSTPNGSKEDWIPILKSTWHRLLALLMAEQGTDLVIVDQINENMPNLKRNSSSNDLSELIKDDADIRDPLGELFTTYFNEKEDEESGDKVPNRQFADMLLKCLNDLQGVSLQSQEYLLIRHAILFTAHEPSFLPSFSLNLIKAVRSIRNIPLDCDVLLSSLEKLVILCPKQTAALFCSHLVQGVAPIQRNPHTPHTVKMKQPLPLHCCNNNQTENYSSQLDYLLHSTDNESDNMRESGRCCDHVRIKGEQFSNPFRQEMPTEDGVSGDQRAHRIEEFDDSCYCEKKVSILSSVLNKSNSQNKNTVCSKLLFSKPQS